MKKNNIIENSKHKGAKNHLTYLLLTRKWKLKSNCIGGEYKIPKKLSNGHQYRLDSYFISPDGNHHNIEYDGLYHFTKKQIAKTIYRDDWLIRYFKSMGIDIKISHFLPDELFGKFKLSTDEIIERVIHSEMYKAF
jgi:hypothetical protein